jgi:hypothetical protein|tara:strand:+ start:8434 stop:8697 length:264 start_codon:yes stop_codon:yes gene_type:complete
MLEGILSFLEARSLINFEEIIRSFPLSAIDFSLVARSAVLMEVNMAISTQDVENSKIKNMAIFLIDYLKINGNGMVKNYLVKNNFFN